MGLLMTVSGLPWYSTLTVTVKGVPAMAVDGATKLSVACVVAHDDVNDIIRAKLNVHDQREKRTSARLSRQVSADAMSVEVDAMQLF